MSDILHFPTGNRTTADDETSHLSERAPAVFSFQNCAIALLGVAAVVGIVVFDRYVHAQTHKIEESIRTEMKSKADFAYLSCEDSPTACYNSLLKNGIKLDTHDIPSAPAEMTMHVSADKDGRLTLIASERRAKRLDAGSRTRVVLENYPLPTYIRTLQEPAAPPFCPRDHSCSVNGVEEPSP